MTTPQPLLTKEGSAPASNAFMKFAFTSPADFSCPWSVSSQTISFITFYGVIPACEDTGRERMVLQK
ncbi:MAG: hypothetical protein ABS46_07990 [Cytophagaceae bacterium SCN 52-12]|nr:MAG: hypothetical protein ABS46_07990 [Cytophagaceae bacterium SCN 52-12]